MYPGIKRTVRSEKLPVNVLSLLLASQFDELLSSGVEATKRLDRPFEYLPQVVNALSVVDDVTSDSQKHAKKRNRSNGAARDILNLQGLELCAAHRWSRQD